MTKIYKLHPVSNDDDHNELHWMEIKSKFMTQIITAFVEKNLFFK